METAVASTMLISRSLGDILSRQYCKTAFHLNEAFRGIRSRHTPSYYVNIYYLN